MESLPFRENNYVSMNIAIRPAYHRIGAYQRDADTAKRIGEYCSRHYSTLGYAVRDPFMPRRKALVPYRPQMHGCINSTRKA
jgi:hypothetical protein